MRSSVVRLLIVVCALLALPSLGYAQEAAIVGTVTDSTGAVLPGITVTAVNEASGNSYEGITDARGQFRIPVRIGTYRLKAELQGFAPVSRSGITLLVGQELAANLQMTQATLQESVTVTAEAPLLEVTQSTLAGNIDSRQMEELPVQGRDWTGLALLAPGNRTTTMGGTPVQDRADVREFHMNLDGQQVTSQMGTADQPRYSRDSIAEFQFISNRFDATQGRSSGVQVNAVTKSGTNRLSGSFAGYFRDDKFNAADHVLNQVVPYSNAQYSGTVGGPIVRDKLHFFGNYEYEREPKTSIWNTRFPSFNVQLEGKRTLKLGGGRLDYQLSPSMRLMGKANVTRTFDPFTAGNSNHPAGTNTGINRADNIVTQFTQVINSGMLNEIKVGFAKFEFQNENLTHWSDHWQAPNGVTTGSPRITFRGFSIPGNANHPRVRTQKNYTFRDDFTFSFEAKGRHDVRAGGEYLFYPEVTNNCARCMGQVNAQNGPVPDNIEQLLPDPFNVDTWDLDAFSSITRRYTLGVGNFVLDFNMDKFGTWVQDDWHVSDKLTLNLGLRYDLLYDSFLNYVELLPWEQGNRPQDADNYQPRLGFAYRLDDQTVIRGGFGKYYGDVLATNWALLPTQVAFIGVDNDGRPDFMSNPFNGPAPTFEQALAAFCYLNNNASDCLFRDAQELAAPEEYAHIPHSWQTSIGFQRQLGRDMVFEADYVYTRSRDEKRLQDNANITYDPTTGVNIPFDDAASRPHPDWGVVGFTPATGKSNYHGLQTSFTKRFSNNWQAAITYTAAHLGDNDPNPLSGVVQVPFGLAPDLGGEYSLAITDQRHRAVVNGVWQVAKGFQMSGIYFFGSGERFQTTFGGDFRGLEGGSDRLREDGSIVPRNNLSGDPIHRVDLRFQQRIPVGGRLRVDAIAEIFNLFNHENFGTYITEESDPDYGSPDVNTNLAYGPRAAQFGFRLTF